MPALLIEAQRVAHTVAHGTHGRRRAGPGETFWQFRLYDRNDSATGIDWRRSASSDRLFVREREWEAAHTAWLWVDLSPSMRFRSSLSKTSKESRAVVLALAMTELLAARRRARRADRRPSLQGTQRHAPRRRDSDGRDRRGEPAAAAKLSRFSECLLFSDFLEPVAETSERLEEIAAQGVRGHLVADPRSRRGDASLRRPHRVRRERRQGPRDRRPRRDLARALPGAAEAASQGSRRR